MIRCKVTAKFIRLPVGTRMMINDLQASKKRPFIEELKAPDGDLQGLYEVIKHVGFKLGEEVRLEAIPKGYEKGLVDLDAKPAEEVKDVKNENPDAGGNDDDDKDGPDRIEKMKPDDLKLELKERGVYFHMLTGEKKLKELLRESIEDEAVERAASIDEAIDGLDEKEDFDAEGNPSLEAINTVMDFEVTQEEVDTVMAVRKNTDESSEG